MTNEVLGRVPLFKSYGRECLNVSQIRRTAVGLNEGKDVSAICAVGLVSLSCWFGAMLAGLYRVVGRPGLTMGPLNLAARDAGARI